MARRYPRRSFLSIVSQWGANSNQSKGSHGRDQRRRRSSGSTASTKLSASARQPQKGSPQGQIPPIQISDQAYFDPVLTQLRQQPPKSRRQQQRLDQLPPKNKNRRRGKPAPTNGVRTTKSSNVVPLNRARVSQQQQMVKQPHGPQMSSVVTPRKRVTRRRTRRPVSPMVYGARLLILGIGIGVISGTVLSIINSLGRGTAEATATDNLEVQETRFNGKTATEILPLSLQLNREIKDLKSNLETIANATPNVTPALMLLDLNTGEYVGLSDQSSVAAASTIKVPILAAFFEAVDAGDIRLDEILVMEETHKVGEAGLMQYQPVGSEYTALETAINMMTISDNTATNMIIDRLGGMEVLNQKFRRWGLRNTLVRNPLPDIEGTNKTSPRDMVDLLSKIHQGGFLSMTSRDRLLRIMIQTENNSLLPKGLGSEAVIAHKTGTLNIMLADVGIVDIPNGKRYVLAILAERTDGDPAAESMIQEMSRQVYQHLLTGRSEPPSE